MEVIEFDKLEKKIKNLVEELKDLKSTNKQLNEKLLNVNQDLSLTQKNENLIKQKVDNLINIIDSIDTE